MKRKKRQMFMVAAVLASLLLVPAVAQARVGGLDSSFGNRGRVATPLRLSAAVEPVFGPDSSIVLLSGARLLRYLPSGEPDVSLGGRGYVQLPEKADDLDFDPQRVAVDSQGRMIVFGSATDPSQRYFDSARGQEIQATWPVVLRLDKNGAVDQTFGEGKGFFRSDFGMQSELGTNTPLVRGFAGRLDRNDRPVLMLEVAGLAESCILGKYPFTWYPKAVARLTSSGVPDPAFGGGDGISPLGGHSSYPELGLDAAGGVAAAVGAGACPTAGNRIFRLGPDGSPLPDFGSYGTRIYPRLFLSIVEPSGAMLLDDARTQTRRIARTLPSGGFDPKFGRRGRAVVRMPFGTDRRVQPAAIDARRRVLLVGSFHLSKPARKSKPRALRGFLTVGRLSSSGKPNLNFGKRGWIATRFKGYRYIDARAGVDPQGRLVVVVAGAGSARHPSGPPVVLARYSLQG